MIEAQREPEQYATFPAAEQNLWVIGSGTETFRTKAEPPIRTVKKVMGKKYFGGGDYDILTFAYNESPGGRRLAVEDAAVKARAAERTGNMYAHTHRVKHDIITGQDLSLPCTVGEKYRIKAPWEKQQCGQ